uniref:MalT-like TPR region domain-containing protein n=1 Tax=Chromera velia CCMP2878 TaxID=1169474 RepID=A0A0G4FX61_9ALVE|eukprot:Cvel_3858.t1-p1 / transcript=Cvel_3858.t1 / gene=Cvel_3858 / organism=Chromera_velia_CCMP2878 / gene_product=hypothetical protein / transcript_product=hypothetical protein / location=Cvel_scaffold163:52343-58244(+) / protein_length=237 / sequence_SO=supercontig / SO=protein_coding / is_pseudo=false
MISALRDSAVDGDLEGCDLLELVYAFIIQKKRVEALCPQQEKEGEGGKGMGGCQAGKAAQQKGDFQLAVDLFGQAFSVLDESTYWKGRAILQIERDTIFKDKLGSSQQPLVPYSEGEAIVKKHEGPQSKLLALLLMNKGAALTTLKRYEEGFEAYGVTLKLAEQHKVSQLIPIIQNNIGCALRDIGKPRESLSLFEGAFTLLVPKGMGAEGKWPILGVVVAMNIARALCEGGRMEEG